MDLSTYFDKDGLDWHRKTSQKYGNLQMVKTFTWDGE